MNSEYQTPSQTLMRCWYPVALSSNEGSGEPARTRRLARAFAARMYKVLC